ncbi:MAG: phage integrase N-terminal SAM-like domain-containing protein [Anaerolineae bacterium]|nr:phage integrase N-terminal SAM-like domain-containing protein [Anaerolineae bacterium]
MLIQVREQLRIKHYARCTEQAQAKWTRRNVLFHDKRDPREMGVAEVRAFLAQLAVEKHVPALTQTQAPWWISSPEPTGSGVAWLIISLVP